MSVIKSLAVAGIVASSASSTVSAYAQTFTTLYTFPGIDAHDGAYANGLTYLHGKLYGTTYDGGVPCEIETLGCGTGFKINGSNGTATVLHDFGGNGDGAQPEGTLAYAGGLLFGSAQYGGPKGEGIVFSFDPVTGAKKRVHAFDAFDDGQNPLGSVAVVGHELYGTTRRGGTGKYGVIYKIDLTTGKEIVVRDLSSDGISYFPNGLISYEGHVYGLGNERHTEGAICRIDPSTGAVSVLAKLTSEIGLGPVSALAPGSHYLYGVAYEGGLRFGTVYKVDIRSGAASVVYTFQGGADGSYPSSIIYAKGMLYGSTDDNQGDASGYHGTIFKLDPDTGSKTILYSFKLNARTSAYPRVSLYKDGSLYGLDGSAQVHAPPLGSSVFKLAP